MTIQDFLRTKISFIGKDISDIGLFFRRIYFCMENNSHVILFRLRTFASRVSILSGDERHYLLARSNNNIQCSPTLPSARMTT